MSIRVRNIISGNRKKIYRLLLLIVLAVTIFSVVIVFGSSRAPAERVSMHTVLGDAVAIFYNDSATVTSKRLVLEEAVAVGAELKGKEGFPLDSLESLERYLGHLSYREGKWDEAVQHYQKARRWNQHLKKGSDEKIMQEADYLFFMASLYYKSGLLDKSEKYYCEEVECLSLLDNHHIYLSDIYNNIGLIYIDREDYNVAVLYFMHALQIMEINGSGIHSVEYQNCINNIGTCLFELDMYQYADALFNHVLNNIEKNEINIVRIANQYQNIATVLSAQQNYEKARDYYKKSLSLFSSRTSRQRNFELQLLLNYGRFLIEHDIVEAGNLIDKIDSINCCFNNISNLQQLQVFLFFGDYYKKLGEFDTSVQMYSTVINKTLLHEKNINGSGNELYPSLSAQSYFEIGEIYYDIYCEEKSNEMLQKSISCFENVSKFIEYSMISMIDNTSQILLKDYTYKFIKLYTSAIIQSMYVEDVNDAKFTNKLLWLSDFCKYDILRKSTTMEAITSAKLKKIVYDFVSQYLCDFSIAEDYLQDEFYSNLINNIYDSTYTIQPLASCGNSYLEKIDNFFLEEDSSLIVNYIHSRDSLYCFVFDDKESKLINLGLLDSIEDSINLLVTAIKKYMPRERLDTRIKNLSNIIVSPLSESLRGKKRCILIGEGSSARVPMECLYLAGSSDRFLIQDFIFEYEFNLALLLSDKKMESCNGKTFAGFAPMGVRNVGASYLPYSGLEIKSIKDLIESSFDISDVFIGKHASISKFSRSLLDYTHVHLSTHSREDSIFHNTNFLFLKGRKKKMYLHHWDLFSDNIITDHLVLSTCYSGSGVYYKGEGLDSFVRLFHQLGIDDIVYTDYQLSDKFAELFFIQYYTHYLKGGKPCEALQISKKYFIENTKYSHPFFWYCIKSI